MLIDEADSLVPSWAGSTRNDFKPELGPDLRF